MLKQLDLSRKVQLIEPIRELIVQENGSHEFLSKEFRDIMRDAEDIKAEHNKWPEMLKTIKRKLNIINHFCIVFDSFYIDF